MKSLQLDSPHAIVVIGIQGSGKTFFAQKFAEAFKAPFVDESAFTAAARDFTAGRQLMNDVLDEMLKTGKSVVIEQSFSSRIDRSELTKRLKDAGYKPMYVWVQVDVETAMNRAYRAHKISDEDYQSNMRNFSPPHAIEKNIVISGKHTFATQARGILKKLSAPRAGTAAPDVRPAQQSQPPQPPRGQIIVR